MNNQMEAITIEIEPFLRSLPKESIRSNKCFSFYESILISSKHHIGNDGNDWLFKRLSLKAHRDPEGIVTRDSIVSEHVSVSELILLRLPQQ